MMTMLQRRPAAPRGAHTRTPRGRTPGDEAAAHPSAEALGPLQRLANAGEGARAAAGYRAMLGGEVVQRVKTRAQTRKRSRRAAELDDDSDVEAEEVREERRQVGIGTFNINHLGKSSEKKEAKLDAIRHLMTANADWLDLLALQEVNDPEVLEARGFERLALWPAAAVLKNPVVFLSAARDS